MWCVVVREKTTRNELAVYAFDTKTQARAAAENIREIRISQNHERVSVSIELRS